MTAENGRRVNLIVAAGAINLKSCPTSRTMIRFEINRGKAFRAKLLAAVGTAQFIKNQWFPAFRTL
jgi:hypothetical protein